MTRDYSGTFFVLLKHGFGQYSIIGYRDDETPLIIRIYTEGETLLVMNTLQRRDFVETSNKRVLLLLNRCMGT